MHKTKAFWFLLVNFLYLLVCIIITYIEFVYVYPLVATTLIIILIELIIISKHISKYPKNLYKEYLWTIKNINIADIINYEYNIDIINNNGIWSTYKENIKFDLKGISFPKYYICAFFIRNINFDLINKNKWPIYKLFCNNQIFNEYKIKSIRINFINDNRIKSINIVKKGKVKYNFLTRFINQCGITTSAHPIFLFPNIFRYKKLCEEEYKRFMNFNEK